MVDVVLPAAWADAHDARVAISADGLLRAFNLAGVLDAADIHVARRLGELCGESDEAVLLGAAFAVRAPRQAHVCVDLDELRDSATSELDETADLGDLPWPALDDWLTVLRASPLVDAGTRGPDTTTAVTTTSGPRPLRLDGRRLYLDRYWRQERGIADGLIDRGVRRPTVDEGVLAVGLRRMFSDDADDLQQAAASAAVHGAFTVVAGGPGTGKTTTVARIVALLDEQAAAAGQRPPRVALAAPTGKAAARLEDAVHTEAARLDVDDDVRRRLLGLSAVTLHRLLGWRPDSRSRFRHDATNHLPHDVVVVDETSMVSTAMMARLVDAVSPTARLILVGDPDQLASVEAGAVLGDIVGPADAAVPTGPSAGTTAALADGIVVLRHVHRFGGTIAELSNAVRDGDVEATLAVLEAGDDGVAWIRDAADAGDADERLAAVRDRVVDSARQVVAAARAGDPAAALEALGAMRVLCAHRHGPTGASGWSARVERWLAAAIDGYAMDGPWYLGRPLLVTANDYSLRLNNGDTGVVVRAAGGGVVAVFQRGGSIVEVSPRRLAAVDTVHAMTIHKSQGSQFDAVAVVLPEPTSPILTRELLYTAVTRAQRQVIVVGSEDSVRLAVGRPIARATGLGERLWGPENLR